MIQWQSPYKAGARTGTLFQVTALLNMPFVILSHQYLSSLSKNRDSSTSLPHKDVSGITPLRSAQVWL